YESQTGSKGKPLQIGHTSSRNGINSGYSRTQSPHRKSKTVGTQAMLQRQYMKAGGPPVPATQILSPDEGRRNVMFVWKADADTKVEVSGSWDGWKRRVELQNDNWQHFAVIDMLCGEYEYKYIIDGKWTFDVNKPKCDDMLGSFNNYFRI
ncbi:hypothetical protein SARC_13890, partial [Sphaeroforma arctica JP610]